jgi:hypothetical protein
MPPAQTFNSVCGSASEPADAIRMLQMINTTWFRSAVLVGLLISGGTVIAQEPAPKPPVVEKLGNGQIRLGRIHVDTVKREIAVPGHMNDVTVLEFVANTRGGLKAYESAVTLETDGITFNAALLLIGLDRANARVPTRHFDPEPPAGDPVELWIEWDGPGGAKQRVRVEQLIYDRSTNETMPEGPWVYTGSSFYPDGRYLADADGVLIGFVHSPAPVIESPRGAGIEKYGSIILNPKLGLAGNAPVTLRVRSLKPAPGGKR